MAALFNMSRIASGERGRQSTEYSSAIKIMVWLRGKNLPGWLKNEINIPVPFHNYLWTKS
jgi:hypothetical protein